MKTTFSTAYLECALWSSNDESNEQGGNPMDANYDESDLSDECREQMEKDCAEFQESNRELLEASGQSDEQSGHDFWLTRCGHGAGFWDRGLGDIGRKLTDACKPYGNVDLYIGDDGKIYSI